MLKIISNPDFMMLGYKSTKDKIKALLNMSDDWVLLGTFLFCNNTLLSADLVEHSYWPEVRQQMAIASKRFTQHYERPDFYEFEFITEWQPGCYIFKTNLELEHKPLVEDDFIRKTSGTFITRNMKVRYEKGTRKKGVFVCRGVNEDNLKKHFKEIQKDMEMWYTRACGFLPLIRKEFDVLKWEKWTALKECIFEKLETIYSALSFYLIFLSTFLFHLY